MTHRFPALGEGWGNRETQADFWAAAQKEAAVRALQDHADSVSRKPIIHDERNNDITDQMGVEPQEKEAPKEINGFRSRLLKLFQKS